VFDAYRGRGRRNNALWLVYSVKTDQDLILSSDRRFVHWLAFLEADPLVKSFELSTTADGSVSETSIRVQLTSGAHETHLVLAGSPTSEEHRMSQGKGERPEPVKMFTDAELKPQVPLAMRWHKALAFAAAIRDKELVPLRLALVPLLRSLGSGTLGQIASEMNGFEEPATFGVFVRLAVEGHVSVDLTASGFGYATRWAWREGDGDVVA
jgi:hypothetical protein